MKDLIERLEKAEAGSRELDGLLAVKFGLRFDPPRFTTSLDDALALVERVLPGTIFRIDLDSRPRAWAFDKEDCFGSRSTINSRPKEWEAYADGATPALALCIALLKAKEAEQ